MAVAATIVDPTPMKTERSEMHGATTLPRCMTPITDRAADHADVRYLARYQDIIVVFRKRRICNVHTNMSILSSYQGVDKLATLKCVDFRHAPSFDARPPKSMVRDAASAPPSMWGGDHREQSGTPC